VLAVLAVFAAPACDALDNGLGLTPAMGFNTWNAFGTNSAPQAVHSNDSDGRITLENLMQEYASPSSCRSPSQGLMHRDANVEDPGIVPPQSTSRTSATWRTTWSMMASCMQATTTSTWMVRLHIGADSFCLSAHMCV